MGAWDQRAAEGSELTIDTPPEPRQQIRLSAERSLSGGIPARRIDSLVSQLAPATCAAQPSIRRHPCSPY